MIVIIIIIVLFMVKDTVNIVKRTFRFFNKIVLASLKLNIFI